MMETKTKVTGPVANRHSYVYDKLATTKIIKRLVTTDPTNMLVTMHFDSRNIVGFVERFFLNDKDEVCADCQLTLSEDVLHNYQLFIEPAIVARGDALTIVAIGLTSDPRNKFLSPITIRKD